MTLYETLSAAKAPTDFYKGEEFSLYNRYSHKLTQYESISYLSKLSDSFGIIRASIVIKAILNKEEIENRIAIQARLNGTDQEQEITDEFVADVLGSLPYLMWQGEKIYVPIFPASLASLYTNSFKKLSASPYKKLLSHFDAAIVDPFDYYGHALFNSRFTKLVVIKENKGIMACYDYESETIYFINDQGRLDNSIALFDKYLKDPNKDHLLRRTKKVVEAYFNNDRTALVDALFQEKFISERVYKQIEEKK